MEERKVPVGRTFGSWTVLGFSHTDGSTIWWRVRCACGNERTQRSWVLAKGKSTRCGDCAAKRASSVAIRHQADLLIGTAVGDWVVMVYARTVQVLSLKTTVWTCRCIVCGAVVDIPRTVLGKPTMPVCRHGHVPQRSPEVEE